MEDAMEFITAYDSETGLPKGRSILSSFLRCKTKIAILLCGESFPESIWLKLSK